MRATIISTLLIFLGSLLNCGGDRPPMKWLAIGQSNMDAVALNLTDMGPADHFAQAMADAGHQVSILIAAKGSTTISCWRRGGSCYTEKITQYLGENIDGVFYWQGENDANWGGEDIYGDQFQALIGELRNDFGNIPVVFVQLQRFIPSINGWDVKVRTADGSLLTTEPHEWAVCREGQGLVRQLSDVHMVRTDDITYGEIHPVYAYEEIGNRAAEIVLGFLR